MVAGSQRNVVARYFCVYSPSRFVVGIKTTLKVKGMKKSPKHLFSEIFWYAQLDSNQRPSESELSGMAAKSRIYAGFGTR